MKERARGWIGSFLQLAPTGAPRYTVENASISIAEVAIANTGGASDSHGSNSLDCNRASWQLAGGPHRTWTLALTQSDDVARASNK